MAPSTSKSWSRKTHLEQVLLQVETSSSANSRLPKYSGQKKVVILGTFPQSEEGEGSDVGKNAVKDLIQHHRGLIGSKIWGNIDLLIIGHLPGQVKVQEGERRGVKIATLDTLTRLLQGLLTFQEFIVTPALEITEYSTGSQGTPKPGQMAEAPWLPLTKILKSTTNNGS
jgi:hypothetical protein